MEMVAERLIAAPRTEVWNSLNDPEVLKACIPGCESIETTGPDSYKIAMVAAVGFIKARFVGDLSLHNKVDNTSYDLTFNGSGGPAGFGKGTASVTLGDAPGGTLLGYKVRAQVGGKLAQVGARVIDGVAKKMADEFFQRLDERMTRERPAQAEAPPIAAPSPRPARISSRTWLYLAVAVALAAVVLIGFNMGPRP
ncbi:MAG: carbon monoxide dehydrogenase subunit G [Pigmentiphaga sp.]|uniref:CoxG family protein n=1 Tax=Pigmentiphaga sp. TaxID=1977564 RepID=UPI0029B0514B|nr:carbon monoxide dehydrogenase subunit G [Pigmentiphaga sp.]MDX3904992.1 carbon monoxide dehydrogenase subunit G [Pigmentiphaga sp.]